ncbi:Hpt domain-containing protein [Varunaivibrio sulfuroxidans]|uniref:Hpt domain-containing protein n=1 Tax=Varunaivibrio sulfuroxidans TaxID=1773489 RepID=A0A4R3JH94_9PROT|nr:Hpt domain-containing protein [Varunaivibrio sulfuroxidans]TCS64703.1 Hpt domain-containing protein [Varunaivibrio sulfuroxidans]WES29990.1 Hpt domain-containing protein [Varunaivibrio sulfuroxidans]
MTTRSPNVGEILARLKVEFAADMLDRVENLKRLLDACSGGARSGDEVLAEVRRQAHAIKGMGGSFGYPAVSAIGYRLEGYLSGLETLNDCHIKDCYLFFDALCEILDPERECR